MARYSRAAAQQHPTNPTTLEDLALPAPYITATSGEPLLLWDSGYTTQHRRSFLFGTPHNTSVLQDADHFIIDGTFKIAPNLMTQMVTVHGLLNSKWHFLLVFGLLPGKTQHLYTRLFDHFGPYDPQSILCDYEIGLHNAIQSIWPSSTVCGCQFHFKQSLWRVLQRTEQVSAYNFLDSLVKNATKYLEPCPFFLKIRSTLSGDRSILSPKHSFQPL